MDSLCSYFCSACLVTVVGSIFLTVVAQFVLGVFYVQIIASHRGTALAVPSDWILFVPSGDLNLCLLFDMVAVGMQILLVIKVAIALIQAVFAVLHFVLSRFIFVFPFVS